MRLSLLLENILSTIHNDHTAHKYLSSNSASPLLLFLPIPHKQPFAHIPQTHHLIVTCAYHLFSISSRAAGGARRWGRWNAWYWCRVPSQLRMPKWEGEVDDSSNSFPDTVYHLNTSIKKNSGKGMFTIVVVQILLTRAVCPLKTFTGTFSDW